MRNFFNTLRRKIASPIIGQQVALYMPTKDCDTARRDAFMEFDDSTLATYTRWFFTVMADVSRRLAVKEQKPLSLYTSVHAVLSLVRTAREINAGVLEITQSCTLGGEDIGVYRVTVEQMPDDYKFGEPGVEETWDGDKLTKLSFGYDFSNTKS